MPNRTGGQKKDKNEGSFLRLDAAALGGSIEKFYQDVEERRLKEWENYQKTNRFSDDQRGGRAFLDISIGDSIAGRLILELYSHNVPNTVAHFRSLITGEEGVDPNTGTKLDYLLVPLSQIDRERNVLIFGEVGTSHIIEQLKPLRDENFSIRHNQRGLLTMISTGPNTSGYRFGITLAPSPVLDFRQVVFGKIVEGMPILERMEAVPVNQMNRPISPIAITFCGALTGTKPLGSWIGETGAKTQNDQQFEECNPNTDGNK